MLFCCLLHWKVFFELLSKYFQMFQWSTHREVVTVLFHVNVIALSSEYT